MRRLKICVRILHRNWTWISVVFWTFLHQHHTPGLPKQVWHLRLFATCKMWVEKLLLNFYLSYFGCILLFFHKLLWVLNAGGKIYLQSKYIYIETVARYLFPCKAIQIISIFFLISRRSVQRASNRPLTKTLPLLLARRYWRRPVPTKTFCFERGIRVFCMSALSCSLPELTLVTYSFEQN